MTQVERAQLLKHLVAEAIAFGTKLSDTGYSGHLWDESNQELWTSLRRLHQSTATFLRANGVEGVSADDVFPLHAEMETIAATRSGSQ